MQDKSIEIITTYIAAWMWHLIAIMHLLKAISFLIVHRYVWMFGMVGVVIVCEIVAMTRKKEVYDL